MARSLARRMTEPLPFARLGKTSSSGRTFGSKVKRRVSPVFVGATF
jgi:hypothetical protein